MERTVDGIAHIPIEVAARELKTTQLRLLMLIKQGVMKGCQLDGEWFVETGSMACFRGYETEPVKHGGCHGSCPSGGCSTGD